MPRSKQVVLQGGLPVEVRVLSAETTKAIEKLEAGGGKTFHGSTKEAFDGVAGGRKKRSV